MHPLRSDEHDPRVQMNAWSLMQNAEANPGDGSAEPLLETDHLERKGRWRLEKDGMDKGMYACTFLRKDTHITT